MPQQVAASVAAAAAADEEVGKVAFQLARGSFLPMVLRSAVELNLLNIISAAGEGAFLSPSEISAQLPTKNPDAPLMLDRLLGFLASNCILKCCLRTADNGEVERLYAVEPICKYLLNKTQDEGSVGPLLLMQQDKVFVDCWFHLTDAILEGGIASERAHGMSAFEYTSTDRRFNLLFNQAMLNQTTMIMNKLIDTYKGFEGIKVLVDVGGCFGAAVNSITTRYPSIKGINYDLPHVVAGAPTFSGVEHVSGDMFVSVPKGDAILLKGILHDWGDEYCLKLLKNCWEALPSTGKVIILETILPTTPDNSVSSNISYQQDLLMLLIHQGGKERTQKEFEELALKSGFSGSKVICCAYHYWVIEFHK